MKAPPSRTTKSKIAWPGRLAHSKKSENSKKTQESKFWAIVRSSRYSTLFKNESQFRTLETVWFAWLFLSFLLFGANLTSESNFTTTKILEMTSKKSPENVKFSHFLTNKAKIRFFKNMVKKSYAPLERTWPLVPNEIV